MRDLLPSRQLCPLKPAKQPQVTLFPAQIRLPPLKHTLTGQPKKSSRLHQLNQLVEHQIMAQEVTGSILGWTENQAFFDRNE